jgi:hypothetical protein
MPDGTRLGVSGTGHAITARAICPSGTRHAAPRHAIFGTPGMPGVKIGRHAPTLIMMVHQNIARRQAVLDIYKMLYFS